MGNVTGKIEKPLNTWSNKGMFCEWRDKCPLAGAGEYLWKKLKQFPNYDWRKPHPPESAEHLWYKNGWSLINHLQDTLFYCSSSHGNSWPFAINGKHTATRLFNFHCEYDGCSEWAVCIVNQKRTGEKDNSGDSIFEWLPDAPRFLCHPHYHEETTGEKYVPPTEEQKRHWRAQWKAQEYLAAYEVGRVKNTGREHIHMTFMDRNYLVRMVALIEFFLANPDGTPPIEMMTEEKPQ